MVGLGVLTRVLMLGRLSQAMQMKRKGSPFAILGAALSLVVLVASVYGVRHHLAPAVGFRDSYLGIVGIAVVISFVLMVPILCVIQRMELLSASLAWGTAIAATACVVVIARVGFEVMVHGSERAHETLERSHEMEAFLEEQ